MQEASHILSAKILANLILYVLEVLTNPLLTTWLTLLHSERPKLYGVLAVLNAIGLNFQCFEQMGPGAFEDILT